jgi:hypothetical protein
MTMAFAFVSIIRNKINSILDELVEAIDDIVDDMNDDEEYDEESNNYIIRKEIPLAKLD